MKHYSTFVILMGILIYCSCTDESEAGLKDIDRAANLVKFENRITIDSTYTYPEDTLYQTWLRAYNSTSPSETRSLSPEDDAFFNKKYIVKSTEAMLLYGRNYIYPGSVLEGNSISNQKYLPVEVTNRKPVTLSMTLNHNSPKPTRRTIENITHSKFADYVKEMAAGGNFKQNEKFMFQQNRFTFYDQIKSAFGTNIDTRALFSSRKENSAEHREKIVKSTGMYVKFFQSCFTVDIDHAPLSDKPVKGKTTFEPVYVSSVTYGRMGVLVLETDATYEFAETCMNKEFSRIFKKGRETLNKEEKRFFENTVFKILIMGSDSDYTVQTVKGYSQFLNLIHNSTFTPTSYGVPVMCTFAEANSHKMVETEFVNTVYIEPLYVDFRREKESYSSGQHGNYHRSQPVFLNFYKDRAKTKEAKPYIDIVFNIQMDERRCHYSPERGKWPMIKMDCSNKTEEIQIRNIDFKSEISVGTETSYYQSDGPTPGSTGKPEFMYVWQADEYHKNYSLQPSPFFIII